MTVATASSSGEAVAVLRAPGAGARRSRWGCALRGLGDGHALRSPAGDRLFILGDCPGGVRTHRDVMLLELATLSRDPRMVNAAAACGAPGLSFGMLVCNPGLDPAKLELHYDASTQAEARWLIGHPNLTRESFAHALTQIIPARATAKRADTVATLSRDTVGRWLLGRAADRDATPDDLHFPRDTRWRGVDPVSLARLAVQATADLDPAEPERAAALVDALDMGARCAQVSLDERLTFLELATRIADTCAPDRYGDDIGHGFLALLSAAGPDVLGPRIARHGAGRAQWAAWVHGSYAHLDSRTYEPLAALHRHAPAEGRRAALEAALHGPVQSESLTAMVLAVYEGRAQVEDLTSWSGLPDGRRVEVVARAFGEQVDAMFTALSDDALALALRMDATWTGTLGELRYAAAAAAA